MELRNFAYAGKVLSEIWSKMVIDNYSVIAEFIDEGPSTITRHVENEWRDKHVMESQYLLQIVKCNDRTCCSIPRSSYFNIMQRFLPAPLPLTNRPGEGLRVELNSDEYVSVYQRLALKEDVLPPLARTYPTLPYDFACPSVQPMLNRRTCTQCKKYFASIKSLKSHKFSHKSSGLETSTQRLAVKRVAAKRQRELMCLIAYGEQEAFEWHDEDDVEFPQDAEIRDVSTTQSGTPVVKAVDITFYHDE